MKILHLVPTFYPATYWGGPIWSTKAICDGIAALDDAEVRVLTSDAAGPAIADRVVPVPLGYPVHYARRVAGHHVQAFVSHGPVPHILLQFSPYAPIKRLVLRTHI